MGQTRASSRKRSKANKPSPDRKESAGYPVDMTEERPGLDQLAGGPNLQTSGDLKTASQVGAQIPASNTTLAESASGLGSGPTTTASAPHADSAMFTEQLHRLRARLQSVVQGVREVAQSLDEPHSLIANVRDQLQSRHDSARRNSLCAAPAAGYDSASRRNSLASAPPGYNANAPLSRNSSGGVGGLRGGIPAPDSLAMQATLEASTATAGYGGPSSPDDGSGGNNWSVKARVAAVELRSRSGGGSGHSEPLPLLQPHGLPMVLERKASMRVVGGDGIEVEELEEEEEEEGASPATPPRRARPVSSGTDSCSAHAAASASPGPQSARFTRGGDGAGLQGLALSQRFDGVAAAANTGSAGAISPVKRPVTGSEAGSGAAAASSAAARDDGAVAAASPAHSATAGRSSEDVRGALSRSSSRGGGGSGGASAGLPYSNGGSRAAAEAAAAAVAAADLVAANAAELLGPGDAGLLAATANAAAAEAYLRDHPETLRELWTLRARVRRQEGELATMVKQLSTKNAQLDQAQVTVQTKEKELSALTQRLTGVLARLQSFQLAHHQQQQELHALQRASLGASPGSSPMAGATSPRALWAHSPGAMTPANSYMNPLANASGVRTGSDGGSYGGADVAAAAAATPPQLPVELPYGGGSALVRGPSGRRSISAAMGFSQHRVFSLRDTGPSLEVSLPPPPSLWADSGPGVSSLEEEEEPTQGTAEGAGQSPFVGASSGLGPSSIGAAPSVNSSPTDVAAIAPYPVASSTAEITTAPRILFAESSIQHASPAAAPSTTAHAPGPGTAPGAAPVMCEERPGDSASDSGSATGGVQRAQHRRRRGLLGLLLQMAPSVACVTLLMRDEGVRQRLEQVRRGLATAGSYRSLDAQRLVANAAAAARSAPLDVGRYLRKPQQGSSGGDSSSNNVEAFESQTTRECKAKWCSIIRPPPTQPAAYYY